MNVKKPEIAIAATILDCLVLGAGLVWFSARDPESKALPCESSQKTVLYNFKIWNAGNHPVYDAHFFTLIGYLWMVSHVDPWVYASMETL